MVIDVSISYGLNTCERTIFAGAELLSFAREKLGTGGPAKVIVMDSLPKNAMGKVLKNELARELEAAMHRPLGPRVSG